MAKYTPEAYTVNEIDFVGHIWQPGYTCVGRSRPSDEDVADMRRSAVKVLGTATVPGAITFEDAMRGLVLAFLKRTQGDFSEILDFRCDFGDTSTPEAIISGAGFYSEWRDTTTEIAFEDAGGYGDDSDMNAFLVEDEDDTEAAL